MSLRIDLAGLWDLETTPEAEQRLRRLLRRDNLNSLPGCVTTAMPMASTALPIPADLQALQQLVAQGS